MQNAFEDVKLLDTSFQQWKYFTHKNKTPFQSIATVVIKFKQLNVVK